jgi:hypothetical protein
MLKKPASGVLGSSKSSTYTRGYASGFNLPAALLDGIFEHPTAVSIYRSAFRINRVQDGR